MRRPASNSPSICRAAQWRDGSLCSILSPHAAAALVDDLALTATRKDRACRTILRSIEAWQIEFIPRSRSLALACSSAASLVDYLPDARPGFNSFQLLLLFAGLVVTPSALFLRRTRARSAMFKRVRKNLLASLAVTAISLLALELLLTAMGAPTHYPTVIPSVEYEAAPWWTCDEAGCHYVPGRIDDICAEVTAAVWSCLVNEQGFHDGDEFVASDDLASRFRILTMGDSFTFGLSADEGKSYVDAIEAMVPDSIVWNTGISGTGTKQALASFRAFAPIMKPHIAIYGFYVNDFDDNLLPIDGYFVGVGDDGRPIGIRNHRVDQWGNLVKLDQATAVYYHEHGHDPPNNPLEHMIGKTRLGSLLLNAVETIGHSSGLALKARNDKRLAITRASLTQMRDEAAALDATLLILLIPSKEDLSSGPGLRHRSATELFVELKIAYFNPIDYLDVSINYAPADDVHWNTAGHQKIGNLLSACLMRFQAVQDLSACDATVVTP